MYTLGMPQARVNSVRAFYESFPCGGEGEAGDERGNLIPWWNQALGLRRAEGRVLEVACGTGFDLKTMAGCAEECWGVDGALRPLLTAHAQLADFHHVRLVQADAAHLPFRDATFNGVWCIGALHHMANWLEAMEECARVLKPHGTFRFLVYRRAALQTAAFGVGRMLRPFAKRALRVNGRVGRHTAAVAEFTLLPVVHLFPERVWLDATRSVGLEVKNVIRKDAWFPLDRFIAPLRGSRVGERWLGRFLIVEAIRK